MFQELNRDQLHARKRALYECHREIIALRVNCLASASMIEGLVHILKVFVNEKHPTLEEFKIIFW